MLKKELTELIHTNVPFVGKKTIDLIHKSKILKHKRIENVTSQDLYKIGVSKFKANSLLLFINNMKNVSRYYKGFDGVAGPADFFVLTAFTIYLLLYFYLYQTHSSVLIQLLNSFNLSVGLFFLSIYWLNILIAPPKSLKFFSIACIFYLPTMILSPIMDLAFEVYIPYFLPYQFEVSSTVIAITALYDRIFKFSNELVKRINTIHFIANYTSVVSILFLVQYFFVCRNYKDLYELDTFLEYSYLFILSTIALVNMFICIRIRSNKKINIKQAISYFWIANLFMIFLLVLSHVADNTISELILYASIDYFRVALPQFFLLVYLLFPNNYFPKLSRGVLLLMFLTNTLIIINNMGVELYIEFEQLNALLGFVGSIASIISLLFFSGTLFNLLFSEDSSSFYGKSSKELVENAILDIERYDTYADILDRSLTCWEVSNLCYNHGYHSLGITFLKNQIKDRKWSGHDFAVINYQMACGYALKKNRKKALERLKIAIYYSKKLRSFMQKDEMLSNVSRLISSLDKKYPNYPLHKRLDELD